NRDGAGFGGLIRNNAGNALLAYIGKSNCRSVIMQELYSIMFGMKGAATTGIQKLDVATDSLRAAHIVKNIEAPPWYARDQRDRLLIYRGQ
ncbi:hypothetical protein FRX31_012372, partial [Thalictrum thalictroides]